MLIDGEWVDGERTFTVRHKVTGVALVEAASASRDQVAAAVAAARASFVANQLSPYRRYEILHRSVPSWLKVIARTCFPRRLWQESGFTVCPTQPARSTAAFRHCSSPARKQSAFTVTSFHSTGRLDKRIGSDLPCESREASLRRSRRSTRH